MAMAAFFHMLQHDHENEELHAGHKKKPHPKRNIKAESLEHNPLKIITVTRCFHSLREPLSAHPLKEKCLAQQRAVVHPGGWETAFGVTL